MPQDNQPTNLKSREEIERMFKELPYYKMFLPDQLNFVTTIRQEDLEMIERWAENKKQPYWTGNLTAEKQLINRDIAYQNQLLNDLLSFITYQKTRV